ncbi:MAG: hypothetical protein J7484_14705 [Microbacterium sp.]|nr:hypothetical protein [Microbacterium sp.]
MRTPRRGLAWWGWLLIGLGAAAVLAVIAYIALIGIGLSAYVNHSIAETSPDQPFLIGDPQDPVATAPLSCPSGCFDTTAFDEMAVDAADVAPLGPLEETDAPGSIDPGTVAQLVELTAETWTKQGGDAECAFVPSNAPYIAARTAPDADSTDPLVWVQVWRSEAEVLDISGRVFPSSDNAEGYLQDLHERVAACPWQDMEGVPAPGGDTSLVQITAQAAIPVPDDVAAVGWTREGTPGARWRAYVWDLQRGNVVLRVRVLTDGRILEQQVADFAATMAARLAAVEPRG